jgi:ribose-phosphate pyrophosphokinase
MALEIDPNDVRFFSGQSHPELAREITTYLQVPLDPTHFGRFSNDNLHIQLGASVRGRVVFIIQSLVNPVSDNLIELFMMLDIAHGAGAREIHAIIPYYSYARSDKKDAPRISIAARLFADLLATSGATHVMTMTLHSPQVHGFFSVPTDPLTARPLFVRHFKQQSLDRLETIVVAPDMGRANAAARLAAALGLQVAAAEKDRVSDTEVEISSMIIQQVKGFHQALVYDDEIATGSSVIKLSEKLIAAGIEDIALICTHGIFTNNALAKLSNIPQVTQIVTTNTVPIPLNNRPPHLTVLSVGSIFGEAILRNYSRQSIGDLFPFADEAIPTE